MLKNLRQDRAIPKHIEGIPNYPQSLPLESICIEKLLIATLWYVLGCCPGCFIPVVKTNNDIQYLDSIGDCPADGPVASNMFEQSAIFGCSTDDSFIFGFRKMKHHLPNSVLPRRDWNHASSAGETKCWFDAHY